MLEIAITDFKELITLLEITIRLVGVRIDEITDDTEVRPRDSITYIHIPFGDTPLLCINLKKYAIRFMVYGQKGGNLFTFHS